MKTRIIAKLDAKPPHIVKPIHFEGLRKIGSPQKLSQKYYEQGADEIVYIDIVASLYQREIQYESINNCSEGLFVPLAVGGGVKSLEDFSKLFHSGADKVVLNTFAIQEDPSIISMAASVFGSQAVVINIEAKKQADSWECYTDCGRIPTGKSVLDWARQCEELGAGEIILQSVDQDGRRRGFDIELISKVVEELTIPVVAASGAGSLEDILAVAVQAKPSGIAISSLLHYDIVTIEEIKTFLRNNGVEV